MSIDLVKLKAELASAHFTPLEFFCIERKCAMIKCYMNRIAEMMIIYIPSKYRGDDITPQRGDRVYHIEEEEGDSVDKDDYAKTSQVPDMLPIQEEKSDTPYNELSKKYQKNISLEGNEEPVPRKIKRQTERLRMPFARLSYDIGIQNGKWLCLSFDGEQSLYSIKAYPLAARHFCFVMILPDLIDKLEDVHDQIAIIRDQFYSIVNRATLSNFENVSVDIPNYEKFIKQIKTKRGDYEKSIRECVALYATLKEKEDGVIKSYKAKMEVEQGSRRSAIESEQQRQFDSLYRSKRQIVDQGLELLVRFHLSMLGLEECSFDNAIMIPRVKANFSKINKLIA